MNKTKRIFLTHQYPIHMLMCMNSELNCVIDVGVNSPKYLLNYAQYFNTVIGVEANHHSFATIIENTLHVDNIQVINATLSNQVKQAELYICHTEFGYSTINEKTRLGIIDTGKFETHDFTKTLVETTYIDKLFNAALHTKVDLLKIDAEGEDINIVFGATELLRLHKPVIQIEHAKCHPQNEAFESYMKDLNYVEVVPYFKTDNYYYAPTELWNTK